MNYRAGGWNMSNLAIKCLFVIFYIFPNFQPRITLYKLEITFFVKLPKRNFDCTKKLSTIVLNTRLINAHFIVKK